MSDHREEAARRPQRQPLEPSHAAPIRDQHPGQAVLARGRAALDHAQALGARDAPHRQAGAARGGRRAARPRREDLITGRGAPPASRPITATTAAAVTEATCNDRLAARPAAAATEVTCSDRLAARPRDVLAGRSDTHRAPARRRWNARLALALIACGSL